MRGQRRFEDARLSGAFDKMWPDLGENVNKIMSEAGASAKPAVRTERDQVVLWDVFISHASEDKEDFVRPLAESLRGSGLRVWYDDFMLNVGDSLRRSIDHGLAKSRYGIVVISPNFLKKEWPQKELDGLIAREVKGAKLILPVWHNISADEIRGYSPTWQIERLCLPAKASLM